MWCCLAASSHLPGERIATSPSPIVLRLEEVRHNFTYAKSRHIGALKAIDAHGGFRIDSMMCTSSGAIVGSLIAAGYSTDDTADVIKELSPYKYLTPSREPWRGCFRLDRLVQRMRSLLPERFEQLQIPLACGAVSKRTGEHICIRSGPLPEAVVSSAAVPVLFKPVAVPGRESDTYLVDGGVSDRIALRPYRESVGSSNRRAICHVVKRSSSRFGGDDSIPQLVKDFERWHDIFIQSPRARESMLGFRAFDFQASSALLTSPFLSEGTLELLFV